MPNPRGDLLPERKLSSQCVTIPRQPSRTFHGSPYHEVLARPFKNKMSPFFHQSLSAPPLFEPLSWLSSADDRNKRGLWLDPSVCTCPMWNAKYCFAILRFDASTRSKPAVQKTNTLKTHCEVTASRRKLAGRLAALGGDGGGGGSPLDKLVLVGHTEAGSGTAAVDVLWEPHLFVNLKEEWGWVFHSLQRKRKEKKPLPVSEVLCF